MQQETKKEDPELREPSPQPNLDSYYRFIEGGRVIPQKISIPLFFGLRRRELELIDGCRFPSPRRWRELVTWRRSSRRWAEN